MKGKLMKYAVVTLTIRDGEFEYNAQTAIKGKKPVKELAEDYASKFLGTDCELNEDGKWEEEHGYRIVQLDKHVEITKEEYIIINKYIY